MRDRQTGRLIEVCWVKHGIYITAMSQSEAHDVVLNIKKWWFSNFFGKEDYLPIKQLGVGRYG